MNSVDKNDFVDKNIERLIKQCQGGDEAMSFLAIYSFIEGYFRYLYNISGKDKKFNDIIDEVINNHLNTSGPAERKLYERLKKYHGYNRLNELETLTDTNRVRHWFSNIKSGTLSVIVDQFIKFAEYRKFLTPEISNMNNIKQVIDSRDKIQLEPSDNSILYHQENDLLLKYDEISKLTKKKSDLEADLKKIDSQIIDKANWDIPNKLKDLAQRKKNQTESLKENESKFSEFRKYYDYINELAISLIEARTKKDFENQIIQLSEAQKIIIEKDIDALTKKDGHSMYIKGGPGTGKTLVLIVMLFKLLLGQEKHKSILLTYYPTLNNFIKYLFVLYNDDKLLNYFRFSKIGENNLEILNKTAIKKFDDFLLPQIREVLKVKNTYSLRDNTKVLEKICHDVESDHREAARLYDIIVDNVLPNMLNEETYCRTSSKKRNEWIKISNILKSLDDSNNMLDLYAYYKFHEENYDKSSLINYSYDYILIDEAQDLTNAQIFAISQFVNNNGGLILAGDPSQEIRNKRITMAQLGVNIKGGPRYSRELTQNFRSSKMIQNLGNDYKKTPCLHIFKNTKSVQGINAGPPPQIFITDDTEETDYQNTYDQIVTSVKMCTEELCIIPGNICIVAFNESELLSIQQKLDDELKIKSVLIYKDYSFENDEDANVEIRLCTLREIKGIDCAVLLFMITDQSKQKNNGGFISELKANAIYTCITRAMFLLQVFVPRYCIMSDLSVAVLVNKLDPSDEEVAKFVEDQNKKERKGVLLKSYFEKYKNEKGTDEVLRKIEIDLKKSYEQKFGSDENCWVEYSEDLMHAYVYGIKKVVQCVQDDVTEISLGEARKFRPECTFDDKIEVPINPKDLYVKHSENEVTEEDKIDFDIHDEIIHIKETVKIKKAESIHHKKNVRKVVEESKDVPKVTQNNETNFKNPIERHIYEGEFLGCCTHKKTCKYCLKIKASEVTSKFPWLRFTWLPAYDEKNPNRRKYNNGDIVTYRIEHDSFSNKPNDFMAIIVE